VASVSEALESLFTKVEEIVLLWPIVAVGYELPFFGRRQAKSLALNSVKLAPGWRKFAESTLAKVPAFIVGPAKVVFRTGDEAKNAKVVFPEVRKLESVETEDEKEVPAIKFDAR